MNDERYPLFEMFRSNLDHINMHIVCGRGKGYEGCQGNLVFKNLIQQYASIYASKETSRSKKSFVVRSILGQLKNQQIRFIKRDANDQWVDLEEREAIIKVRI